EVRQQRYPLAQAGKVVERAHGHVDLVAHAIAIHQHLWRILVAQRPRQSAYHWVPFAGLSAGESLKNRWGDFSVARSVWRSPAKPDLLHRGNRAARCAARFSQRRLTRVASRKTSLVQR